MAIRIAALIAAFFAGAGLTYLLMRSPEPPRPETQIISAKTYEQMFNVPERFRPPPSRIYITPTVTETRIDTVRVPVDRPASELRLFYGDLTVRPGEVQFGTFNPATRQWEAQRFAVPEPRFRFEPELLVGWPLQTEAGLRVSHRSGLFAFGRAGVLQVDRVVPYFGVGIGVRW